MGDKVEKALNALNAAKDAVYYAEKNAINTIKELLTPCGEGGCLIGTEDYCDDIFYVYAEPNPNKMQFVTRIRCVNGELEVLLAKRNRGELVSEDWIRFDLAHIADIQFLLEEIMNNIEYSNGYQEEE